MIEYEQRMGEYVQAINDGLRARMPLAENAVQNTLIEAVGYGVLEGGKRLRGVLTMEFSRLTQGNQSAAITMACAVEMLHAYSLIHDDLPCMDNDDMRRGKPSCHKRYGETVALLAGDALLTSAFETIARAPISAEQRCKAILALAENAGIHGMIGGQMMDMHMEGQSIDETYLRVMDEKKTARLLCAACLLGCYSGTTADTAVEEAALAYAEGMGMAFQITDDILDVTGDSAVMGKNVGSDAVNDKTTFVTLLGLEGARECAKDHILRAKAAADLLCNNGFLHWILDGIMDRTK